MRNAVKWPKSIIISRIFVLAARNYRNSASIPTIIRTAGWWKSAIPGSNRFRKILVRFEKLEASYLGLLEFACAYIVFKRAGSF